MVQTQRQSKDFEPYMFPFEQFFKWKRLRPRIRRFKVQTQVCFLAYFEPLEFDSIHVLFMVGTRLNSLSFAVGMEPFGVRMREIRIFNVLVTVPASFAVTGTLP